VWGASLKVDMWIPEGQQALLMIWSGEEIGLIVTVYYNESSRLPMCQL